MTVARATRDWLDLREPADARARSTEIVEQLRGLLSDDRPLMVHDLGCGTGSTRRWLAPQLSGPQHWIEHDRDAELLQRDDADATTSLDGMEVSIQTRCSDLSRLDEADLTGASLITASALLDMLTADELRHLVSLCASVGSPCLITLSVVGNVELIPSDPLDVTVEGAFNQHQRRTIQHAPLLGPEASTTAVDLFRRAGMMAVTRPSPWRLGPQDRLMLAEWFEGWLGAACEQDPTLFEASGRYAEQRRAQLDEGRLHATIHHDDLLAWHP